jgi:hypothetical protein
MIDDGWLIPSTGMSKRPWSAPVIGYLPTPA